MDTTLSSTPLSAAQSAMEHLDAAGVAYKAFEHEQRFTAAAEALAAGVQPHDAAKALLCRDGEGYRLAVIPASERLDLEKVRRRLHAEHALRLASEPELAADFPQLELGAVPPLGSMLHTPTVVDERLLEHGRILCNAGDHRHSLLIDPRDIVTLSDARVGNICAE